MAARIDGRETAAINSTRSMIFAYDATQALARPALGVNML
jgi:hypothetical protein